MLESKNVIAKTGRDPWPAPPPSQPPEQKRLMVIALTLLLIALGLVLYRDRDFWFPDTEEAANRPLQSAPTPAVSPTDAQHQSATPRARHLRTTRERPAAVVAQAPVQPATVVRTALPPLEVEVVAGDAHRTLRPGTNSVHVELQPGAPQQQGSLASPTPANETNANVSNAAERSPMSAESSDIVTHSVTPGYPMLARQMKVQGSVILQALIGRDGKIQDLRVLSGPPILARAAQEAVRQWHFKPHHEGVDTVETQARITVNFTISTY